MSYPSCTPDQLVVESGLWDGLDEDYYNELYAAAINLLEHTPLATPELFCEYYSNISNEEEG